jgi:UPF0042 nucleotide-binding protein
MPERIIIVTGLSGSGKSTAIKVFEDLGYFCVDNMPVALLSKFLELMDRAQELDKVALGMDIRDKEFVRTYPSVFSGLIRGGNNLKILFLEASEETLIQRYALTRRKHPLATDGKIVSEAIREERERLADLKDLADWVVDTSKYNIHRLKAEIARLHEGTAAQMNVILLSFGFKHGLPREAELVMDVRVLPNPFFVDDLKELDGRDGRVQEWIMAKEESREFMDRLTGFLSFLIPKYFREGKRSLTVAVGCTGGQHRSVMAAERLKKALEEEGISAAVVHRDVGAA